MKKRNRPATNGPIQARAPASPEPSPAEASAFNECFELYRSGRPAEALALVEKALPKHPNSALLLNAAAASAKATGDIGRSELYWRAAIASLPNWPDPQINLANLLCEIKRSDEAEAAYRRVLEFLPDNAEALNGLGSLLLAARRIDEAEAAYRMALKHKPQLAEVSFNLGMLLQGSQRFAEAKDSYEQALRIKPDILEAQLGLAGVHRAMGRVDDADAAYRQALALRPESVNIYINLGTLLQESGRLPAAEVAYREALAIDPASVAVYNNLTMVLKDTGRQQQAETACRRALAIWPEFADAYNNLGLVLNHGKRFDEAEVAFQQSLRFQPDSVIAYNNLGTLLLAAKRHIEAEECFTKALTLKPDFASVLNNLGNLQHGLQRPRDAETSFKRAVGIDPRHFDAYNNLGSVLQDLKRFDAAEAAFLQTIMLKGVDGNASGQAYLCARCLCDWRRKADDETLLAALVERGVRDVPVFNLLSIAQPGDLGAPLFQLRAAKVYAEGKYFELSVPAMVDPARHVSRDRLRIGYLSADFHEHATMYLLQAVLEAHDRSRFALYGYSYGPTADAVTLKAMGSFDVFRDLKALPGEAAAALIADDDIDILVDLKGYTGNARLEISALRPAPVIVNWLGYPGTLGHPRLADYLIGDPIVSPPEHAAHFSETLALMPHCYQPNDRHRAIGSRPGRAEEGLPDSGLVFCSFNQSYKYDPETFGRWCRLLNEVPGSVLWLLATTDPAVDNLRREAQSRGVSPDRLVFAPVKPMTEHLGRLQLADLALDTFPVTSHTTASDTLWAGVPLITRIGDSFVSRVAASLLNALGLNELVTEDLEDYYALALALALDPPRLAGIRAKLEDRRLTSPLFDTARFTRDLERLYSRIWEQHAHGQRALIALEDDAAAAATQKFSTPPTQPAHESSKALVIVRIAPQDYSAHRDLDVAADGLLEALKALGCDARSCDNALVGDCPNILIGAHLLTDETLHQLPQNVILYNLEKLEAGSIWMRDSYLKALASHRYWDGSQNNIRELCRIFPTARAEYVPLGYSPIWSHLERAEEDIDILLCADMNPRQRTIVDELKAAGLKVHAAPGAYGEERDELVRRAKLVLNVHPYESLLIEFVPISYLMANGKAIVSECGPHCEVYPHLRDGLYLVGYDQLVSSCLRLLQDDPGRRALAERARSAVQALSYRDTLAPAVSRLFAGPQGSIVG